MTDTAHKSEAFFPLAGAATDGFSNGDYASATCFCGKVQLKFALTPPGLNDIFLCDCTDCRKITATTTGMHNIVVLSGPPHLVHLRGEDDLTRFEISSTTTTGNSVTNLFCKTCGTLMYRTGSGFPGTVCIGGGTVDDLSLVVDKLKPRVEQFVERRPGCECPAVGVRQVEGDAYVT